MTLDERQQLVSGLLEISRLPDCPESQTVAILALENFLIKLKAIKAPAASTNRHMAYDLRKIRDAGRDIDREGYHPDMRDNIDGFYIPEFNAVFLMNGRHHIAAAKAKGIPCFIKRIEEYSLEDAFLNLSVSTYGRVWIFKDIHSKQESQINVSDPRIALMYDLARERHLLQGDL